MEGTEDTERIGGQEAIGFTVCVSKLVPASSFHSIVNTPPSLDMSYILINDKRHWAIPIRISQINFIS